MATTSTLLLRLAEDFYLEDARFRVSVDGVAVGEGTVTARRGGQQPFTFTGDFGPGPRVVTIDFLNDAYGGTDATDRNLIVEGITLDGVALPGAPIILFGPGPRDFAVPAIAPDVLVLRLAEDFYMEDARFAVSVDGVRVGEGTVTARRGSEQAFTFTGDFGPGPRVVTIDFLNDAYAGTDTTDRNLIVEGISLNGLAVPNGSAILFGSGPRDFAVSAAPGDHGSVSLADVANGIGGYKISGAAGERSFLAQVTGDTPFGGADFNGDGRPDATLLQVPPFGLERAAVAYGRANGGAVDLSALDAASGATALTNVSFFVQSLRVAGDVNGDGVPDFLAGDPRFDTGNDIRRDAGRVVVAFGRTDGVTVDFEAAAVGNGGFTVTSFSSISSGNAFTGLGDLNGDGLGDLLIGAPTGGRASVVMNPALEQFTGAAYVVYGKADGARVNVPDLSSTSGFSIIGEAFGNGAGGTVAAPGDLNGDGRPDLLVSGGGSVYAVFGDPSLTAVDLRDMRAGIGGFIVPSGAAGNFGGVGAQAALGDVNGDGRADFLVSGPAVGGRSVAYVVYGKSDGAAVQADDLTAGVGGFAILAPTGGSLTSAAGVGDADGDGRGDLLLGLGGGGAVLLPGRDGGRAAVDLDAVLAGTGGGVFLRGEDDTTNPLLNGSTVSAAGDVNGDGLADLLIGAPGNDALGRVDAGAAYVVYGRSDWFG